MATRNVVTGGVGITVSRTTHPAPGRKDQERDRVLVLYRRGRVDLAALDRQSEDIERERTGLAERLGQLEGRGVRTPEAEALLDSAGELLRD